MSNNQPPESSGQFLIGNLQPFLNDRLNFLMDVSREYGDFVKIPVAGQNLYLINNTEAIHQVLVTQSAHFERTSRFRRAFSAIVGEGIMTMEKKEHQARRQLVQPAFHHRYIQHYAETMVEETNRMFNQWRDGQVIHANREMMNLTLSVVTKTLFGSDITLESDAIGEAILTNIEDFEDRLFNFLPTDWLPTAKNKKRKAAKQLVEATVTKIIEERRASGEEKHDFLGMLLNSADKNGNSLSNQEIMSEALTFLASGHETTANVLTWALHLISQNPDVEAKLMEEVDSVLGNDPASLAHYRQLDYTSQVINETMRLYPPLWLLTRIATADVEINGYHIKKGSVMLISPYTMHRNPDYYIAPDEFLPERFVNNYEKSLPKYAYIPFGGGERICIGKEFAQMEMRLVLATVMQNYRLKSQSSETIEPLPLLSLRPSHPVMLEVSERQKLDAYRIAS